MTLAVGEVNHFCYVYQEDGQTGRFAPTERGGVYGGKGASFQS